MKRAMKVYTFKNNELLIGFDYETDKAYIEIENKIAEDLLQYDDVPKRGLRDILYSFKNIIDEVLSEVDKY